MRILPHLLSLVTFTCAALGAAEPLDREPFLWPFASNSIWNTPIGSGAVYVPASVHPTASTWIGGDLENHIQLAAGDPVHEVRIPSAWNKRWPGTSAPWQGTMPVPDSLLIDDASGGSTPNQCSSFLMPDARTVIQLEPACRTVAGAHIVGYRCADVDIYGAGIIGTHYGSGLSVLGGSIRRGELTGSDRLRHAIKLNLYAAHYYHYSAAVPGYRWPATTADSYANGVYGGTNPKLVAGSLLAIPPGVSPATIGITHPVALKLFAALQDYGVYLVDDSAWDAAAFSWERGVDEEVQTAYGVALNGGNGVLVDQLKSLITALNIVDNNSPSSIGGGGTPRRPFAPPLADPTFPVPGSLSASGPAGAVQVQWSDPSATETGFEISRRPAGGTWSSAAVLPSNNTTWSDAGATAGTSWEYRVRLLVFPSASAWSATVTCSPAAVSPVDTPAPAGAPGDQSHNFAADQGGADHCGTGGSVTALLGCLLAGFGRVLRGRSAVV